MGETVSESGCKTAELEAYQQNKEHTMPKEKLKSLNKRQCGPLQLSALVSTVKLSSHAGRTHQISFILVLDRENGKCALFFVHAGDSAYFEFWAVAPLPPPST